MRPDGSLNCFPNWPCRVASIDTLRGIGIRIEDNGAVTRDGHKVFSVAVPKEPVEIEALLAGHSGVSASLFVPWLVSLASGACAAWRMAHDNVDLRDRSRRVNECRKQRGV